MILKSLGNKNWFARGAVLFTINHNLQYNPNWGDFTNFRRGAERNTFKAIWYANTALLAWEFFSPKIFKKLGIDEVAVEFHYNRALYLMFYKTF